MRRRGAPALALVLAIAGATALAAPGPLVAPAYAEDVELPGTRAKLRLPPGWKPVASAAAPTASSSGLVAGYRGDGMILAVTRARTTNLDAYRSRVRDAYADQIERGVASGIPGYRRVSRKLAEQHGTPALDLEATRRDGATIVVRVLLFWTYALALAIEVPPGASAKPARAIAATFAPPKRKGAAAP